MCAAWSCGGPQPPSTPAEARGAARDGGATERETSPQASSPPGDSESSEASPPPAEKIFFAALPLESTPEVAQLASSALDDSTFAERLRLRMHVMRGYPDLGEMTKRSGLPLVNGVFQMSNLSHLSSRDVPRKHYRTATFVVDFEEPAMEVAARSLQERYAHPQPEDIARFVSEYIVDKSYQRAFDVASRVASSKSGDCTEHAVLTTALLRRSRYPARVILGVVVLAVTSAQERPHLMAVGHSWVEYHDGKQWRIVDAALRPQEESSNARAGAPGLDGETQVRLAYLPITVIEEEGAGFTRALMDEVGVESVLRVELDVAP